MAHTQHEKKKLLNRARRIRGQVQAIEKALADERDCGDTLQRIAACRGALNALMAEVIDGHVRFHVVNPCDGPNSTRARAAKELLGVVRTYLK